MLGSLVGAGLSAVGGIFGGISASKAMKKVRNNLQERMQANEAWYNRRYNEDATQRADAQRILTRTEDAIRNRNRQAAATQAVVGGTEESVAAAKAAGNQVLADATAQIAANAEARKDQIEQNFQQRDAQLNDALNNVELNKAKAIGEAGQAAIQTGAGIAEAF